MSESYYRLSIRFTNGDTTRFFVSEPVDTASVTEKTKFVLVRTVGESGVSETFLASLADVSFIKTEHVEGKELRHRVAGITSGLAGDDTSAPDAVSTVEFI